MMGRACLGELGAGRMHVSLESGRDRDGGGGGMYVYKGT